MTPPQSPVDYESFASFEIEATTGQARAGTLRIGDTELTTPNLFPVINFFGGGRESALFGGGIHRTIKEFMVGSDRIGGGDFSTYFDGVMMSIASLTDFGISRHRFEDYVSTPIQQRGAFQSFDGMLFIDSGGFKFLSDRGLDGADFDVEIDQRSAFEIQQKLGGDLLVNLDRPITPEDPYEVRVEKAKRTAENAAEFLRLSADTECARYLTVHGYNYAMIDTFLKQLMDVLGSEIARTAFDGIALGSLVPKKHNKSELITAVRDCRAVLLDHGFAELPLHVLGISSSSIPLLVAFGVDTFDSSSYLQTAINGKYSRSLLRTEQLDDLTDADFEECGCPVCSSPELVKRMQGDAEYQKDILGPVAVHNLIIQKRELADIRARIVDDGPNGIIDYIESTVGRHKSMRQFAHMTVNEALGGYSL